MNWLDPRVGWSLLSERNAGDDDVSGVLSMPTDVVTTHGAVRYALSDDGLRCLLIPVPVDSDPPRDCECEGVAVRLRNLQASDSSRFMEVTCRDEGLKDAFSDLVGSLLGRIATGSNPDVAVPAVLDEFRRLLRRRRGQMSDAALRGLIGELVVLRELAAADASAVHVWVGPQGERHDFARPGHSLEVKTTSSLSSSVVTISSIDQLAPMRDCDLHLVLVRLQEGLGDLSLNSLRAGLIELGVPVTELDGRLAQIGVDDVERELCGDVRYALRDVIAFRVDETFPRLVRSSMLEGDLPVGIVGCEYRLDLGYASDHRIEDGISLIRTFLAS